MGHNIRSDRWISLKILQEFPEAVFLEVDVESLLGDAEVSSPATRVPVRKGHNFGSNRWISPKILQEFSDIVFLGVDVESLLADAEVSSLRPDYGFERAITFDPTVGSPSKFYRSFRTPFS